MTHTTLKTWLAATLLLPATLALAGECVPAPVVAPPPPPPPVVITTVSYEGSDGELPPRYLSVPAFKNCLAIHRRATYESWCLPTAAAADCPAESWSALNAMTGKDRVPACP